MNPYRTFVEPTIDRISATWNLETYRDVFMWVVLPASMIIFAVAVGIVQVHRDLRLERLTLAVNECIERGMHAGHE